MYTDEPLLKLESEEFLSSNSKLYGYIYNRALEDFERKMAYFCFGLKASQGNMCRVDVVEDELQRVKRQLKR